MYAHSGSMNAPRYLRRGLGDVFDDPNAAVIPYAGVTTTQIGDPLAQGNDFVAPVSLPSVPLAISNVTNTGSDWITSIAGGLSKFGNAYLTFRSQDQLNQLNIARARAGLPPYGTSAMSANTTSMLVLGGLAVAGILLILTMSGGKGARR